MTVEGLRGAARLTWGVNLSYPYGPADTMEVARGTASGSRCRFAAPGSPRRSRDRCRTCSGSWPAKTPTLVGSVDDAIKTMALVEACYESSVRGATPVPAWE